MTDSSSGYINCILHALKCASIRSRLITAEIDSIDAALRGNFITTDDAIAWLHETGAIGLIAMSSAIILAST